MLTDHHHHRRGTARARATSVIAAIGLLLVLIVHDALMASDAHARTAPSDVSTGAIEEHNDSQEGRHGAADLHHDDPGEAPPQPCSTMREAASRTQTDVLPDEFGADTETRLSLVVAPMRANAEPPPPLPADVRRAFLQVFLN